MGAVTKPWDAEPVFRAMPPDAFSDFPEPDYVKIVWTLRADPVDRALGRPDGNPRDRDRRGGAQEVPTVLVAFLAGHMSTSQAPLAAERGRAPRRPRRRAHVKRRLYTRCPSGADGDCRSCRRAVRVGVAGSPAALRSWPCSRWRRSASSRTCCAGPSAENSAPIIWPACRSSPRRCWASISPAPSSC